MMLTLLIYIVIFMVVSSFMSSVSAKGNGGDSTSFKPVKTEVASFSDERHPADKRVQGGTGRCCNLPGYSDETVALQDALYYREVSCIIRVPEGFTKKSWNGENVQLEKSAYRIQPKNVHMTCLLTNTLTLQGCTFKTWRAHAAGTGAVS